MRSVYLGVKGYHLVLAGLLVIALVLVAPVGAADHILNPGDSIQNAINSAASGDTIILNPGTYYDTGITISGNAKVISIQANTAAGGSQANTNLAGGGTIFTINGNVNTLNIDNLNLNGGIVINGNNNGIRITSSTFNQTSGHAIFINGNGHSAQIISSTFSRTGDSAILNNGNNQISIASSTFTGCSPAHWGGAIFTNGGNINIINSRIYDDGIAVFAEPGSTISARNNWWGSNSNPSGFFQTTGGSIQYDPWLVLGATASPGSITTAQDSTIQANLTYDSDGIYHNPVFGHVPDGIPVTFALTGGTGIVLPLAGNMTDGANATIFTPGAAGTSSVTATVDGQSLTVDIPIQPAPSVTTVSPSSGPLAGGTAVTITGTDFTGATAVTFEGTPPAPAAITTLNGAILATSTTIPVINAIRFPSGPNCAVIGAGAGAEIVYYESISGNNLIGVTRGHAGTAAGIWMSGTTVSTPFQYMRVDSATRITAISPPGPAGTVDITITFPLGTSRKTAADHFTYIPPPGITGISPSSGPTTGSTVVTITGTGFTGATAVTFGGTAAASYTIDTATQITATTPAHATGTIDVTVTTPNGISAITAADQFIYIAPPAITGISPSSGPTTGSTVVTITGTGFTGATAVTFGGTAAASYTVDSATRITATTPAHAAGAVDVTVTTAGGTASGAGVFTYVTPASPPPAPQTNGDGSDNSGSDSAGSGIAAGGSGSPSSFSPISESSSTMDANVGGNSAVNSVTVTGTGVSNIIVTGVQQESLPPGVPSAAPVAYQYVDLTPARSGTITAATITFEVPVAWLNEHGLTPGEVAMSRYHDGAWATLPTTSLGIANGMASYSAQSPGFSLFAIIPDRNGVEAGPVSPTGTTAVRETAAAPSLTVAETGFPRLSSGSPVAQQTTAPPAPAVQDTGFPLMTVALIGAGCVVLIGGGVLVRRWWIRRQNPALFQE
jgi:PGF-pre-PGF domain-containing protein